MSSSTPDWGAVKDKRMCDLTPAQQEDARELWLREHLGGLGEYHRGHYKFLLKRLDEARAALTEQPAAPQPGNLDRVRALMRILAMHADHLGTILDRIDADLAAAPQAGPPEEEEKEEEEEERHCMNCAEFGECRPNNLHGCGYEPPAAPAQEPQPSDEYDHEKFDAIAAARYRVVPANSGFWGYAVEVGDSTAKVYKGHKRDCELVARRMAGAFLDGAFLASQRATAPAQEPQQPAPTVQVLGVKADGSEHDLGTIPEVLTPKFKMREIVRSYFGHFEEGDDSQADMCMIALEEFQRWYKAGLDAVAKQPAASSPAPAVQPCAKILDHKWLDPECVETGCQSLVAAEAVAELVDVLKTVVAASGLASAAIAKHGQPQGGSNA